MNANIPPTAQTTGSKSESFDIGAFLRQIRLDKLDEEHVAKSEASLRQNSQQLDQKIKGDTHQTRQTLIGCVGCVSFLWIVFTAVIVLMLGFRYGGFDLSDAVAIAFLTTSLGTVLGLMAIGLRFFFSHEK